MTGQRKYLSNVQKNQLKEVMLSEMNRIKYRLTTIEKMQIKSLPDYIKDRLMINPKSLKKGITLFECYGIFKDIDNYIESHRISDSDPNNLWVSRAFWADIIYKRYIRSKKGKHEEGFYFINILFSPLEVNRFRKLQARRISRKVAKKLNDSVSTLFYPFIIFFFYNLCRVKRKLLQVLKQ